MLLALLAVLLLFFSYAKPFYMLCGGDTNELAQDWFESKLGIESSYNKFHDREPYAGKTALDMYSIHSNEDIFQVNRFGRSGFRFYMKNCNVQEGRDKPDRNFHYIFYWNKHIYGEMDVRTVQAAFRYWKVYVIAILLVPAIYFFLLHLFLFIYGKRKTSGRFYSYVRFICFSTLVYMSFLSIHFIYYLPAYRNYQDSYKETFQVLDKNIYLLKEVLSKTKKTGLYSLKCFGKMEKKSDSGKHFLTKSYYPLGSQEKNIHSGNVFISKSPFFPHDYIRINIDLFNYIYFSPTLTETQLSEINPVMVFTNLKNGLWLGQYNIYIEQVKFILLSYYLTFIIWGILIIHLYVLWKKWKPEPQLKQSFFYRRRKK